MRSPMVLTLIDVSGSRRVLYHTPRNRNVHVISCSIKRSVVARAWEAVKRWARWQPEQVNPSLDRWA